MAVFQNINVRTQTRISEDLLSIVEHNCSLFVSTLFMHFLMSILLKEGEFTCVKSAFVIIPIVDACCQLYISKSCMVESVLGSAFTFAVQIQ